jgi:hypothetical protein
MRFHNPQCNSSTSDEFQAFCDDPKNCFRPQELGFLPVPWGKSSCTFHELVTNFFQKKNSSSSRFLHKLFNALKIGELNPLYFKYLGVEWVTDTVLKVDKTKFARLLGIKTIDGSLFHRQGNFPSHGFIELTFDKAKEIVPQEVLNEVDFDTVRLLVHEPGQFFRGCGPDVDRTCKWINRRKKEQFPDSLASGEAFISV